jgi:UDP-glucose:(heptosyl)LPS alpha-1,3-glucosyltransferase
MNIAFAIVSLFPGGGLQRDCVDIARRVRDLGHEVTIFTSRTSGEGFAEDLPVHVLGIGPRTNHGRQRAFSKEFARTASQRFDLLVGFDKLSGLDVLYCSDRSVRARVTNKPILQLMPRYWEFIELERECFGPNQSSRILLLSQAQMIEYWTSWITEPNRMVLLPPTLMSARRKPESRTNSTRDEYRSGLGLASDVWTWIAVAVQPKTKGIDRSIRALRRFADAHLLIVGLDETDPRGAAIRRLSRLIGVAHRVKWLGHREDISELMAAADLLVHPARYDTTGTVILEAIANGLPVITTSACGYAQHVSSADAGIVVPDPFRQRIFITALEAAHDPNRREQWSKAGIEYGKQSSLCEGRPRAAELIVASALESRKASRSTASRGT